MRVLRRIWTQFTRERGTDEANAWYLYWEIIFYAALGAAASFDGAYVVRLGASNMLVGLQSSLPALAAATAYLPAARFLEGRKRPFTWLIGCLTTVRLMYLLFALWPLISMRAAAPLVVATIVLMQLPAALWATGWSPLLADVVPERSRSRVLSWRMILLSATVGLLTYGFGLWLEHASFPSNYQWMYAAAVLSGLVSVRLVSKLRVPKEREEETPRRLDGQKAPVLAGAVQLLKENRYFRNIVTNTLVFNSGFWLIAPLYTILFVKQLNATDGWIGLRTMLLQVGGLVGYLVWRRFTDKWGDAKTLLVALPIVSTFPFLLAAFPNLKVILFTSLWVSLASPGVDLPHSMIFMSQLPRGHRHMAVALYSMIMNAAACVMPLIGVALSEWIGLLPTLVVGGVLRTLGAGLFYWRPIKEGMSLRALFGARSKEASE